jgi:ATP-dependent Clp protease ATP-binding subunit ClpE
MLQRLSRLTPLFMAAFGLVAMIQLLSFFGGLFSYLHAGAWLAAHSQVLGFAFGASALPSALLAWLAYLRARNRLPNRLTRWTWLMDILDRLTNRKELEERLRPKAEAIYIDAPALAEKLKSQVIGQDEICDDLSGQIRRRLALQQRGKPVGVFLFAGPPGVGKTYLGKVLAKELARPIVHIDMTQFASGGHAATSLFGSPKGYVGSDSYGKLTSALRDKPNALVLLDEFEKAHSNVHKNFLTAWNDGFITEASNERHISTTSAIFVLTTNAALEAMLQISKECVGKPDDLRRNADAALRVAGFAPEVLSRIDRIFVFNPLQDLDVARVAALEIETMIQGYGLVIEAQGIDPQILLDLMDRQTRIGNSASSRDLLRSIEESIADSLIDSKQRGAESVRLVEDEGRVTAIPAPPAPPRSASPPSANSPRIPIEQAFRTTAPK